MVLSNSLSRCRYQFLLSFGPGFRGSGSRLLNIWGSNRTIFKLGTQDRGGYGSRLFKRQLSSCLFFGIRFLLLLLALPLPREELQSLTPALLCCWIFD